MILYAKTYENIKRINKNFPIEDAYWLNDNSAIVADGITRDPIGISDFSAVPFEKKLEKYPRPSGASEAAKIIVNSYDEIKALPKKRLIYCNKKVKELNDKKVKNVDYLENDYYGAVASAITIKDNILYYAYICDCGVIIYDKNGNIKFKTDDDKVKYSDSYIKEMINKNNITWNMPETRVIVRRDFRNNLNNIVDGKCISYGALTGEVSANSFIKEGYIELDERDYIIVYSDGFSNFLVEEDFINRVINFDKNEFDNFVELKSKSNSDKYGSEKTLILIKHERK